MKPSSNGAIQDVRIGPVKPCSAKPTAWCATSSTKRHTAALQPNAADAIQRRWAISTSIARSYALRAASSTCSWPLIAQRSSPTLRPSTPPTSAIALNFLLQVAQSFPYKIHPAQTNNGVALIEQPRYRNGATIRFGGDFLMAFTMSRHQTSSDQGPLPLDQ